MKVDTRILEAGAVIESDVCIVGAGPAGITIAHQLRGTALDVCLLEGGGLEHSKRSQDLYEREIAKTIYRRAPRGRLRPTSSNRSQPPAGAREV